MAAVGFLGFIDFCAEARNFSIILREISSFFFMLILMDENFEQKFEGDGKNRTRFY